MRLVTNFYIVCCVSENRNIQIFVAKRLVALSQRTHLPTLGLLERFPVSIQPRSSFECDETYSHLSFCQVIEMGVNEASGESHIIVDLRPYPGKPLGAQPGSCSRAFLHHHPVCWTVNVSILNSWQEIVIHKCENMTKWSEVLYRLETCRYIGPIIQKVNVLKVLRMETFHLQWHTGRGSLKWHSIRIVTLTSSQTLVIHLTCCSRTSLWLSVNVGVSLFFSAHHQMKPSAVCSEMSQLFYMCWKPGRSYCHVHVLAHVVVLWLLRFFSFSSAAPSLSILKTSFLLEHILLRVLR